MTFCRPRFALPLAALAAAALGTCYLASRPAAAADATPAKDAAAKTPVAKVEKFTLPDMHGKDRSFDTLTADKKLVVVAFLGVDCPLARLYAPRLEELNAEFAKQGVAFIGIDANHQDSLTDMTAFAQKHGVTFPLLKYRDQAVADKFGVERNPSVYVLDADRKIRYRGRIDDQYGQGSSSGYAKSKVNRSDLGEALNELLAGKEVSEPQTQALGCLMGRKPKVAAHGEVTYANQIAGLLQERCVFCHRPGEIGPFALQDYDEVVGWADMIREVVKEKRMPPWSANPEFGHFSNDTRLTDKEKELLYTWIDNGCPKGDPKDLPAPRQFSDGWQISAPDQVVKMPRPFKVPAEGVVDYQHIVVDPGWTEDKWVQMAEARAGNRAVVHHIIVFVLEPEMVAQLGSRIFSGALGGGGKRDGGDAEAARKRIAEFRERRAEGGEGRPEGGRGGRGGPGGGRGAGLEGRGAGLTAYVPGSMGTVNEPGVATFVPKGSKLVFQMHYTPNGVAQEDQSYVGVVFADPKTVKKRSHGGAAMNRSFVIPAGDDNYAVQSQSMVRGDQMLLWMSPHMHLRGKAFRFEAKYPDGKSEVLLDVPKYDFNWQLRYTLAEPKLLPSGTTIQCTAHFDNSDDNVANPDPSDTVRWGPQTWHEMMIGFYGSVSVKDDAHLPEPKEEKKPGDDAGGR
jgi:peroxiredoxin